MANGGTLAVILWNTPFQRKNSELKAIPFSYFLTHYIVTKPFFVMHFFFKSVTHESYMTKKNERLYSIYPLTEFQDWKIKFQKYLCNEATFVFASELIANIIFQYKKVTFLNSKFFFRHQRIIDISYFLQWVVILVIVSDWTLISLILNYT